MEEVSAQTEERITQAQTDPPAGGSKWGWMVVLLILLFLLFSLGLMVIFIQERTTFFGRAFGPAPRKGSVEIENSYMFASPLRAQADGTEKIRMTIVILDSEGLGVAEKLVVLGQDARLTINPVQPVTDSLGKAIFDLSSTTAGEYFLEASIDNQVLPQRVRVSFR